MKALLMFRHQAIPPHISLKTGTNHKFPPLAGMNIRIPSSLEEFHAPNVDGRRRILVNNFNATVGGGGIEFPIPETDSFREAIPAC